MNPLLTPQSICELDTFTLEEQIEKLDCHPHKALFAHIIQIAKLELIDRLQIQEFGRQLANDQYKIDFDFNLPSIVPKAKTPVKPSVPPNRKQFMVKMQMNLVPAGSFVTVGKPAVSNQYKPRRKELQPADKPKSFLKAKKCSYSKPKPKITPNIRSKPSTIKLPEKDIFKTIQKPTEDERASIVFDEAKVEAKPEVKEFSLKQKLKKQVEEMKVDYRQNDAYDDMKIMKMSLLNLKEEEAKIIRAEEQSQEKQQIYDLEYPNPDQIDEVILNSPDSIKKIKNYKNQSEHQKNPYNFKITQQKELVLKETYEMQPFTKEYGACQEQQQVRQRQAGKSKEHQKKYEKSEQIPENAQHQSVAVSLNRFNPSVTITETLNDQSKVPNKELKSKSVKNFNKKVFLNIKSDIDHCEILNSKLRDSIASNRHETQFGKLIQRQDRIIKNDLFKPRKSGFQYSLKPLGSLKPQSNVFQYHEIISSFTKLFPHSKNLLVTLRNVEENLRLHFDKNVSLKCVVDECRKVDSEQLTFKVVSESQKARKNRDLFNIQIDSFYQRGRIMLNRLKNELEEPEPHEMLFYRVVRTKEEVYDIINSSFHRTVNWFELPHGLELKMSWNLLWTWSRPQIDFQDLFFFQKVNHFIGNKQIARKDLLKKNIQKIQKLGSKMKQYFDIIPETFLLPGENIQFIKKFRENGLKDSLNYWILKPVGLSRGRGISLINKLEDVIFSEPIVLQKYIMNPLLIDGFKFDMRIYVLVTSINPLEAFLYQEGFARLSTEKYSISQDDMDNKFVHLTNFSIQRENLTEDKKLTLDEQVGGSKISLRMLAKKFKGINIEWSLVQKQIEDIILKSLIASMNTIPQNPNCFELFGYDIFIDGNLKCWLLEVNSSPSLEKEYTLDQIIKQQLVDDIVQIVDPINYDRSRLLEVVERRRKECEGLKSSITTHGNSTQQLNEDLDYILHGKKLRKYGEEIKNSNFKMIAPSENYHKIIKILQQYKIDPIVKQP